MDFVTLVSLDFFDCMVDGLLKDILEQNFKAEYFDDLRIGGAGGLSIAEAKRALRLNEENVKGFFFSFSSLGLFLCIRMRVR